MLRRKLFRNEKLKLYENTCILHVLFAVRNEELDNNYIFFSYVYNLNRKTIC